MANDLKEPLRASLTASMVTAFGASGSKGSAFSCAIRRIQFGRIGEVIKDNAQFKFFLKGEQGTYREASEQGIIPHQGLTLELIESLQNHTPYYSELFLDTPFGSGVARLAVDPWTYWVNTSHGGEVFKFEQLVKLGLTPLQAIEQLSGEKR